MMQELRHSTLTPPTYPPGLELCHCTLTPPVQQELGYMLSIFTLSVKQWFRVQCHSPSSIPLKASAITQLFQQKLGAPHKDSLAGN